MVPSFLSKKYLEINVPLDNIGVANVLCIFVSSSLSYSSSSSSSFFFFFCVVLAFFFFAGGGEGDSKLCRDAHAMCSPSV